MVRYDDLNRRFNDL